MAAKSPISYEVTLVLDRVQGGAENGGSSICEHGGVFRNESAPLQESLQTQSQVNTLLIDNLRIENNNENQFVPKRSNFPRLGDGANNVELERCLGLPDGPSNYRTKLRGGNLESGPFRKNRNNRGCLFMVNNESSGPTNGIFSSDGFQNPCSEPDNNGSQSHTNDTQFDLNVKDYLNRSYIEDNDFICDFDNLLP
ncbi:hypothetical protein DEO72_LG6g2176 [Vigna unguiculata]|uniref:Uncharacterized protein n=1 Tax=Vigna unguiculata TaxID=3917 RepID=A0A4D6MBM2_VIGUN|nr:hypothetical protein DEO72_LG6g2176 [Vigna unguiculata]